MRLCIFILRFFSKMEKWLKYWKPKKVEETFFLYDLDTQEIEDLYH
jgi:hypothetical protein